MNFPMALLVAMTNAAGAPPASAPAEESINPLRRGAVELSTAASFSSSSSSDSGDEGSVSVLNLPLRVGYMVTRRLELEAEGQLTHVSYDGPSLTGHQLGGHALYHFGEGKVVPFVLAGASVGDSADFFGVLVGDEDQTITSLRAGAGLKAFLGRRAAFRAEYRFLRYSLEEARFDPEFSTERMETVHPTQHRFFAGLSIFFP
jgi:opacity protein-like surface antigen